MDESEKQSDLEIQELSLIDVSFEDDCLINSAFTSPLHHPFSGMIYKNLEGRLFILKVFIEFLAFGTSDETTNSVKIEALVLKNQEQKSVKFLEPFEAVETSFNSPEVRKEESQPVESLEPGKTRSGQYNLRKRFLDSEELSSMIGGTEKREKHVLPGIQEDIHRSTDSLSTLDSDTLTLKSLEVDLFKDIRASIQKSSRVSNVANSNNKKKLGVTESQTMQSSKNENLASRDKMKPKIASRKLSAGTLGPGKTTKQTSSVVTNGELTSSPCKPPKAHGRINPIPTPTISTKRASMGANRAKLEKDNHKNASGKGAPTSKIPSSGSRNIVPRPTLPSRSSLRSSTATKAELTTSCSSFGSSCSVSSDNIGKISLNSMKRKNNSGISNASSAGSTVKSMSRTAPKGKSQSGSSHITAYLRSVTKHSSSISPASSISEWSSESTASTSTANQRRNSTRASVDSNSSKSVSVDNDALQRLNFHDSNDQSSAGNDAKFPGLQGESVKGASMKTGSILCPSSKPSGLRLPSPKIGFFDGVRSAGRTPNGSMQSHPGVPSALPKIGAGITSPSGGSIKSKLGKIQPARTAFPVRNVKPDAQQSAMTVKPRSPLPPQESLIAATKVSSASKNVKSPLVSPRFQSRLSSKTGRESVSKAEKVDSKGHHISAQNSGLAEKKGTSSVLKQRVSPKSNGRANEPGSKFTTMNEELNASHNLIPTFDAENINPSQQVVEDATSGQQFLKNDLSSVHKSNEKETVPREDEVDVLTRQVGAMDINVELEKKVVSPSPESILAENN
ncbi:hypothetical protein Pint_35574 [Pistacia integerrima]|uniref:Uncharacterized protein n=1 Tax=Pistacia integerrima TaxID=434235 RepID=A0ACC0Y2T8_9ROSI|nr:hypothetical protein Pint_35574 [Pistacia integerrima]